MVTYATTHVGGLIVRTAWDEYHAGPVELLIVLDTSVPNKGKGITERSVRGLPLRSMAPARPKTQGSLKVVGAWLDTHKPALRMRVEDPSVFFAHVALFFVLAVENGERGVIRLLANYAGVRPTRARKWILIARKLGFLGDDGLDLETAGRAHGVLTDKARQVLASELVTLNLDAA